MADIATHLFSYPVKGLAPYGWSRVKVKAGGVLPFDRKWAIKKGNWAFDPQNPEHRPKTDFYMLMRDEKLAQLRQQFNPETQRLTVMDREGRRVDAILGLEDGRANLARFLAPFLGEQVEVVGADNHSFCDVDDRVLSLINLASVQALGQAIGAPDLNPLRFRANLYFKSDKPWGEFEWVGKKLKIGETTLEVTKRIQRCAATGVNLKTAQRDHNVPKALTEHFGHADMGVYARVTEGGFITPGDEIKVS